MSPCFPHAVDLSPEAVGREGRHEAGGNGGYTEASRRTYRAEWLGDLAERAPDPDRATFIARGRDECLAALGRLGAALAAPDADADADPWCHGAGAWPGDRVRAIEYRDRLPAMGAAWDT